MVLAAGDRFAGFVVRGVLGHGGSSEVYLADDPEHERRVSLKILGAEESRSPIDRVRFVHEFEITSALDHPNIVRLYAHGECDGRLWSAHDYVAGVSAATLAPAARRCPELARALTVLDGMAAGLDYAHGRGVVHLDIKPANVLVGVGNPLPVKLSDFDSARWLDKPEPPLADNGHVVLSVPYAAPELLHGGKVSPATDQYALACTAVELLTGLPPYPRPTPMAIAQAHLDDEMPSLARRQPWIPPAADAVLRRALAKEPTARYASCTEPIRLLTIALEDATPAAPHLMPWQPLLAAALSRYRRLRTRHP